MDANQMKDEFYRELAQMMGANDNYPHSFLNIQRQVALNNLQAVSADFQSIQNRMDKDVRDYQAGRK